MKKYFKDNIQYFRFINKNKEKINIITVKPLHKKDSKNKVVVLYEALV